MHGNGHQRGTAAARRAGDAGGGAGERAKKVLGLDRSSARRDQRRAGEAGLRGSAGGEQGSRLCGLVPPRQQGAGQGQGPARENGDPPGRGSRGVPRDAERRAGGYRRQVEAVRNAPHGPARAVHTARRTHGFTESVIRGMTRLANEHGAINLAQGFPNFPAPEVIKEAAARAIRADINQYAITWGAKRLRDALARKYADWYGMTVDPETELTVTCGATEAMAAALMAIVDPGEEVIVFEPFYENYGPDAILCGAKPVFVPMAAGEGLDLDRLTAVFTPRTRAIVLCTPNNPTGHVFSRAELEAIAELCRRHDAYAVTDEIYEHIYYAGDHIPIATLDGMRERTVTVSGASKTYSITGWRIGTIVAPAAVTDAIRKVHDFLTVGAPAPLQEAVAVGIETLGRDYYDALARDYRARRDLLCGALVTAGFRCTPPEGAYYVLADFSALSALPDDEFAFWLTKQVGVAPVPGRASTRDPSWGESWSGSPSARRTTCCSRRRGGSGRCGAQPTRRTPSRPDPSSQSQGRHAGVSRLCNSLAEPAPRRKPATASRNTHRPSAPLQNRNRRSPRGSVRRWVRARATTAARSASAAAPATTLSATGRAAASARRSRSTVPRVATPRLKRLSHCSPRSNRDGPVPYIKESSSRCRSRSATRASVRSSHPWPSVSRRRARAHATPSGSSTAVAAPPAAARSSQRAPPYSQHHSAAGATSSPTNASYITAGPARCALRVRNARTAIGGGAPPGSAAASARPSAAPSWNRSAGSFARQRSTACTSRRGTPGDTSGGGGVGQGKARPAGDLPAAHGRRPVSP